MEVEFSIQLSVNGRVDIDVGLFSSQLLDVCVIRLEAFIF